MKDMLSVLITILLIISPYVVYKFTRDEKEYSKKQTQISSYYVLSYILVFFIVTPYMLQYFPQSYGLTSQIWVSILVLILDWVSLYEDKSRFSEANVCLFGNCRKNAMYTGVLAHLGDVIALVMMLYGLFNKEKSHKLIFSGIALFYTLYGTYFIYDFTKSRSESDLRGKSEEEKCKKNRIMNDKYRGILNMVITIFGVVAGWQSVMDAGNPTASLKKNNIFVSWMYELIKFFKGMMNSQGSTVVNLLRSLFIIFIAILPSLPNHINTSYQYAADPSELKLPKCFD